MPEGDTVYHTAAKLREALQGKKLTRCDVRMPQYATVDLTGERVDEVVSRAIRRVLACTARSGSGRHDPRCKTQRRQGRRR